jgi:hypothetical protein
MVKGSATTALCRGTGHRSEKLCHGLAPPILPQLGFGVVSGSGTPHSMREVYSRNSQSSTASQAEPGELPALFGRWILLHRCRIACHELETPLFSCADSSEPSRSSVRLPVTSALQRTVNWTFFHRRMYSRGDQLDPPTIVAFHF